MKTYKHLILGVAVTISSFESYAQSLTSTIQPVRMAKNPGSSFALSFILPGAGQMYNDQVTLGLLIFFSDAILITSGQITLNNYYHVESYHNVKSNKTIGTVLLGSATTLSFRCCAARRSRTRACSPCSMRS